ncbi:GGDEF domain-containing protein [Actinoplanes sp. NBRC 103695]|uniref:GGDEF domain-containing protein n=1 Tax=Actinoplanes sp. NBRC 103695 TaxID=3032202 RepID=UPI00249FBB16|nr:GGDEF domain-containing protein [Actinoplanes sp. NBRC 103695]GLY96642.1 hypothetical protein Acsp02_38970 [Actinoplanes sp. NBRC 103695]
MTWLRRWDPLLVGGCVVFTIVVAYLLLDLNGEATQLRVFWTQMPFVDLAIVLVARAVSRRPGASLGERRLWRAISAEFMIIMAGDSWQAITVWRANSAAAMAIGPVTDLCNLIGVMPGLWVLLTYHTNIGDRHVRRRYLLDSATVGVGISALMYFLIASSGADRNRLTWLFGAVILGVIAFAVCNLVLAGVLPVSRPAALMMGSGILLQGWAGGLLGTGHRVSVTLTLLTLTSALLLLGARLHQVGPPVRAHGGPRRAYSVLPYCTLLIGFGLIPIAVRHGIGFDFWFVIAGLFLTTLLVVVRQLLAFRENGRLLVELDASLQEARLLQGQLRHQATHDALTGMANRALFDERLRSVEGPAAILLIDLDGFKAINDTYGHHAGDVVLTTVGARLHDCVPPDATAARLGGDEFAVILPGMDEAAARRLADDFLARLTEPVLVDDLVLTARASAGVAAGTGSLLRAADAAMYQSKRAAV